MSWEKILERAKGVLRQRVEEEREEQGTPSPFRYPWEEKKKETMLEVVKRYKQQDVETKRPPLPKEVWDYVAKKRKEMEMAKSLPPVAEELREELTQRVKMIPKPEESPPSEEIPCGGTCAAGRRYLAAISLQPGQQEEVEVMPQVVSPGETGKELSFMEMMEQQSKQWTEEVARKEEEKKKKELDLKQLPFVRVLREQEEALAKAEKEKSEKVESPLPWDQQRALKEAISAVEEQQQQRKIKVTEPLSSEEEEALDTLLEKIDETYAGNYERMRHEIRNLKLGPREKEYLGEQFQDNNEPEEELNEAGKAEAERLAQRLWNNNKGDYDEATDALVEMRNALEIDSHIYDAAWDVLHSREETQKKEKAEAIHISRKGRGLDLEQLAKDLMKIHNNDDFEARSSLEDRTDLTEEEKGETEDYINEISGELIGGIEDELLTKSETWDDLSEALWNRDDLTDMQKEELAQNIEPRVDEEAQMEYDENYDKPSLTWNQRLAKIRADKDLMPLIRQGVEDIISNEMKQHHVPIQPHRRGELVAAGVLKYETHDERVAAINAIPGLSKDDRDYFMGLLEEEEEEEKEERKAKKAEQEEREKQDRVKYLLARGNVYEKRPGGYTFRFNAKKKVEP